jgi:hypothetical protein
MKAIVLGCIILLSVILIGGCATTGSKKAAQPAELIPLTASVPTLETVEGYPWELTKDAVTIKLAPVPFEHKAVYERSLKEAFELIKPDDRKLYKITDRPHHLKITPDTLILKLHVVNNLSHVLRFHGAVISCNVDGKSLPLDEATQNELLRAVLTPYASLDVTIKGPTVSNIEKASTLNFAIYDVITEVDAANNPTKRTTFEWIFSIRPQQVEDKYEIKTSSQRLSEIDASHLSRYIEESGQ